MAGVGLLGEESADGGCVLHMPFAARRAARPLRSPDAAGGTADRCSMWHRDQKGPETPAKWSRRGQLYGTFWTARVNLPERGDPEDGLMGPSDGVGDPFDLILK